MSLKNIKHDGVYYNPRLVVKEVIVPSLKNSNKLNIIAGYFTVDSLLEISEGLETFFNSSGKINLILGIPQKGLDSTNKGMVEAMKIAEESKLSSEIVEDFEELLSSNVESLKKEQSYDDKNKQSNIEQPSFLVDLRQPEKLSKDNNLLAEEKIINDEHPEKNKTKKISFLLIKIIQF